MRIRINVDGRGREWDFLLISHRGGRGFGPENTLQSLRGALEFGVEMVETDVRMTGDGIPIIHHSPFLGHRLVGRMPLHEIREKNPQAPTLREFLDTAGGRCRLNLEIKKCDPDVLADVLRGSRISDVPLVSSFDGEFLLSFRKTGYRAQIGLLTQYELGKERMLKQARRCGASVILPLFLAVDKELVHAAHFEGVKVIPWTVNTPSVLTSMVEWEVDGVITDAYADLQSCLLAEYGERKGSLPTAGWTCGSGLETAEG